MRRRNLPAIKEPRTTECAKCRTEVDLDHPLRHGTPDECDTTRLIGECSECGELVNVDLLAESDDDRESEMLDLRRERD